MIPDAKVYKIWGIWKLDKYHAACSTVLQTSGISACVFGGSN